MNHGLGEADFVDALIGRGASPWGQTGRTHARKAPGVE